MHHSRGGAVHHCCIPDPCESPRTAAPVNGHGAARRGFAELFVPTGRWALLPQLASRRAHKASCINFASRTWLRAIAAGRIGVVA